MTADGGPARRTRRRRGGPLLCAGLLGTAGLLAAAAEAGALARPLACVDDSSSALAQAGPGRNFGPCTSPDTVTHLPPGPGLPAITVSNFGLIFPVASPALAPGKFEYVCDDVYDRQAPTLIRRSPTGTLFIPSVIGLLSTSDGCTITRATGAISEAHVRDVAFDRKNPQVVFALGGTPRVLWRSGDGGKTFAAIHTFPQDLLLSRVVLPESRTSEIYVFGYGGGISSPMGVSKDDGATFVVHDAALGVATTIDTTLDFAAVDPLRPEVIYFSVVKAEGDEIWRSNDGGLTSARLLQLRGGDALAGLAFGATPGTIYVAGKTVFFETGKPPGRLYISRDGGATWLEPVVSGPNGPHFNCLSAADGKLYACGTNRGSKDDALLSVSADEGATWQPTVRLADITGPKSCVIEACQGVARWLCDTYEQCAAGGPGPAPRDAATPPVGVDGGRADGGFGIDESADAGCGCQIGRATASSRTSAAAVAMFCVLASGFVRRRWRDRTVRR